MAVNAENVTTIQQEILHYIKEAGEATNAEIASHFDVSYEAIRQHLRQLEGSGLLLRRRRRHETGKGGRPLSYYRLSSRGDHLFPKHYDQLAVELIDALIDGVGTDALREVLANLTDAQVEAWAVQLQGMTLAERLEALKGIYLEDDPFMHVDETSGELRLVERNCPYLNVASRRPALCSVTVSTLSRLLGHRVTREKKFQAGHGRCVFRVHLDEPLDDEAFRFEFEDENV